MAFTTLTGAWAGSGWQGRLIAEVDDLPAITSSTTYVDVTLRWHVEFTAATYDNNNVFHTWGSWPDTSGAAGIPSATKKQWNVRVQTLRVYPRFDSTLELHIQGELSGVENIGGGVPVLDKWIYIPRKPYKVARPRKSYSVSKTNATTALHSWVNDQTDDAGESPTTTVYIDRAANGIWTNGYAGLSPTTTSWSDAALAADRKYEHRIWALGPGGASTKVTGATIYTTPTAPTDVQATKDAAGDITVTWTSPSTIAAKWQVFHASNGAWEGAPIATVTGCLWKHVAPGTSATHTYRVVAVAPDDVTVSANSAASNVVQLLSAPYAPLSATPNGQVLDKNTAVTLAWLHSPADGTPQSAYEIQRRTSSNGGATWTAWASLTGKVMSATSQHTLAAGYFAEVMVEFRVRTWGSFADPSPWSATAAFRVSVKPTVAITSPTASQALAVDLLTVTWTFAGAAGATQTAYEAVLKNGSGAVLEVLSAAGSAGSATFSYRMPNASAYSVELRATDFSGLTSATATRSFSTNFLPPPAPGVQTSWEGGLGLVNLTLTNAGSGSQAPASNVVYRKVAGQWVKVGTFGLNTTITDPIPDSAPTNWYRVETVSTLGVVATTEVAVETPNTGDWFWVNYGTGFTQRARARYNPTTSTKYKRGRQRHAFAGRSRTVGFVGALREFSVSLSFDIEEADPLGNRSAWIGAVDQGGTVCYRDPLGRRVFGSIEGVSFPAESLDVSTVSFTIEEEDYAE